MATMLVVGALLLIQSFVRLQRVDLGFQPDHLLTARIRLPQPKYDSNEKAAVFFRTLIEEIRNMPGIVSAGITSAVPLGNPNTSMRIVPVERPSCVPEKGIQGLWRMATADYLATLKVPLRRGRLFNSGDAGRHAIVLSESLAGKKLWPDGSDPLERAVRLGNGQVYMVVGIVGDVRHVQLNAEPGTMYFEPPYLADLTLVVRTQGDPVAFAPFLRQAVHRFDPKQPLDNIRTMDRIIEQSSQQPYIQAVLFGCFGMVALLLGAVGVAGVVAHTVERRTRDLAVRLALGATPGNAMRSAARGSLAAASTGLALGLAGAWGLGSFFSTLWYHVRPDDPATFIVVDAVWLAVALIACWLPARRVTRIDPVVALRME
jgi:putative ABC transport system permease protein